MTQIVKFTFPQEVHKGGKGSGNFGHSGRPGKVGGSGGGGGSNVSVIGTKQEHRDKFPIGTKTKLARSVKGNGYDIPTVRKGTSVTVVGYTDKSYLSNHIIVRYGPAKYGGWSESVPVTHLEEPKA